MLAAKSRNSDDNRMGRLLLDVKPGDSKHNQLNGAKQIAGVSSEGQGDEIKLFTAFIIKTSQRKLATWLL